MSQKAQKKEIAAIKGTKDILPSEVRLWQRVESIIKRTLELYGYREIRTPVFEATELFEKGTGETSDIVMKEMYTFKDKGGRSLTLRPEYTPSITRSIIEHRLYLKPQPLRFYYIGPMFRYDKPQKGRYRQFHQLDIEVFNEKDAAIDAEIVEMAASILDQVNVREIEILINSVGCRQCRSAYHKDLRARAERMRDAFCADCRRKITTNPLRIFDCKVETCREASQELPKITDYLCPECDDHFQKFCSYMDDYGLKYQIEPRLVRGLDYYTKTTFEIVSSQIGAQDAVLGGGRYDDMMKDFGGPDICGTGFAMGMERLLSLVSLPPQTDQYIYMAWMGERAKAEAMQMARFFRQEGVECLVEYKERSLKNQMSRASKLGAPWVLIIGEDEVARQKYQLKDMQTGTQNELTRAEILSRIRPTQPQDT